MKFLIAIGLLLATLSNASAGIVHLAWDYQGTGHKGFRIYYGTTSHAEVKGPAWVIEPVDSNGLVVTPAPYDNTMEILDPDARTAELVLPEGVYYFRLTAIGDIHDSVFAAEEPMAAVGIDAPTDFKVEWIITKTTPREQ